MWNCSEMTAPSSPPSAKACVGGAEMLLRIGAGLSSLVQDGVRLQDAVASAREERATASLTEALQGLDWITQRLEALAQVVNALQRAAPSAWLVDACALSGGIGLESLRLELLGQTPPSVRGGAVDLW